MEDILSLIIKNYELLDKDVYHLLTTCKYFNLFINRLFYQKVVFQFNNIINTSYYNQIKKLKDVNSIDKLPYSVTHINFGDYFNKSVDGLGNRCIDITNHELTERSIRELCNLPNSITHITFGWRFNQSVDKLPDSITHITFGYWFNQSVDKLPESITHITFVWDSTFNQSVDNLPNSVTHITFGHYSKFNQIVDKLPNSVTNISKTHACVG